MATDIDVDRYIFESSMTADEGLHTLACFMSRLERDGVDARQMMSDIRDELKRDFRSKMPLDEAVRYARLLAADVGIFCALAWAIERAAEQDREQVAKVLSDAE